MNRREQALQIAVMEYLAVALPRHICFHPPMGGYRAPVEAAILQSMGARKGTPDVVITGKAFSGYIELKVDDGKLSDEQITFALDCAQFEIPHRVCRSVEEVEAALRSWGLKVRAHVR